MLRVFPLSLSGTQVVSYTAVSLIEPALSRPLVTLPLCVWCLTFPPEAALCDYVVFPLTADVRARPGPSLLR